MDPSANVCSRVYSFSEEASSQNFQKIDLSSYDRLYLKIPELTERRKGAIEIIAQFSTNGKDLDNMSPIYDTQLNDASYARSILENSEDLANRYFRLQERKDIFAQIEPRLFKKARVLANPFEAIGNSIFLNRAAIKLANIDAIFNVSFDSASTFFDPTRKDNLVAISKIAKEGWDVQNLVFADVAGGPGGFTEYLQYRHQASGGMGITLLQKETPSQKTNLLSKAGSLNWDLDRLDLNRFSVVTGSDGTGNLYTNWSDFATTFVRAFGNCSLVVADGGFDTDKAEHFAHQEILSSFLFLTEILIAIRISAQGANLVLKVFDTVTTVSAQLVWILSLFYRRVSIFKPVSSRPANAERYLVAMDFRWDRVPDSSENLLAPLQRYLERAAEELKDAWLKALQNSEESFYLADLFPSLKLPAWLISALSSNMEESIRRQEEAIQDIFDAVNALENGEEAEFRKMYWRYNYDKFLLIWNLPSNRPAFSYRYLYTPASPVRNKEDSEDSEQRMNKVQFGAASKLDSLKVLEIAYDRPLSNLDDSYFRRKWKPPASFTLSSKRREWLESFAENEEELQKLLDLWISLYAINLSSRELNKYPASTTEMLSSPLAASMDRNYCSPLEIDRHFNSDGNIFDRVVFREDADYVAFVPPSVYLIQKLERWLQKLRFQGGSITFYLPYWPNFDFVSRLSQLRNAKIVSKLSLFDYSRNASVTSPIDYLKVKVQ